MEALCRDERRTLCPQVNPQSGLHGVFLTSKNRAESVGKWRSNECTGRNRGWNCRCPQARPEKGQLIRDFTLAATSGQEISLSDYRGRSNLVLVLREEAMGAPTRRF